MTNSGAPAFADRLMLDEARVEAMARGLMCYPMGGTVDGRQGDHVLLAPPYIATNAELDRIVDLLGAAADAALASLRKAAA